MRTIKKLIIINLFQRFLVRSLWPQWSRADDDVFSRGILSVMSLALLPNAGHSFYFHLGSACANIKVCCCMM